MTVLAPRPPIGARVRVRGGTGLGVTGHVGTVAAYHADGIAVFVDLDDSSRRLLFDPKELDLLPETRCDSRKLE